jgi:hypothetical protein
MKPSIHRVVLLIPQPHRAVRTAGNILGPVGITAGEESPAAIRISTVKKQRDQ